MQSKTLTTLFIGLLLTIPKSLVPLSVAPRDAMALTAIELQFSELVAASHLVVEATPVESMSVWEDQEAGRARRIVTYTRLQVGETLDGAVANAPVWVRTLGGHVGSVGQRVEGETPMRQGQPAVFFLHKRADSTYSIVGMSQGHFPVDTPKVQAGTRRVLRAGSSDALVARIGHVLGESTAARVALDGRTLNEVRQLIAEERAHHAQ